MERMAKWTREQLEECTSLAKARFKDYYSPEAARSWINLEYSDVKEYLEEVIPESIRLHGIEAGAIRLRKTKEEEAQRTRNKEHYGRAMTDQELAENPELFEKLQKNVNKRVFGIECTDDELFTKYWTDIKAQVVKE